ncbi:MAG: phytanoyl-CoA dioxygenase family protein [Acidimicrobiales bacterium]
MVDAVSQYVKQVQDNGYVIIPSLLDADTITRVRAELEPHFIGQRGRNEFEGLHTERLYALLAKAPAVAELVEHPTALAITDQFLRPSYLLWGALAINNHPGETAQSFHADDDYVPEPRPRSAAGVSTMWTLDDFTETNGATELIPGSHRWGAGDEPGPDHPDTITAVMPAGSLLLWLGSVYHRGGANRGDSSRLGITVQYCQPWLRQIENMVLAVPPDQAARYSDRVQRMLGYGLFGGSFMGYVDGRDPKRLVDGSPGSGRTDAIL